MKILVTGAAGFIGYHLAAKLADSGHAVLCVDNFVRGENDALYRALIARDNVEGYAIDLTETNAVQRLPSDVDAIFHLAALNGTQNFYERPLEVVRCSTLPTLNLLQKYCPLGRIRRFIYAGTSESYASTVTRFNWPVPTAEDVPLSIDNVFNPRWSYAASKLHGEVATIAACTQHNVHFTIIRYHNAYGPRMGDKHVIPDFYMRARQNVFELYGHEDTRSFIYIDDAVRATLALSTCEKAVGQVVNVGGAREIVIRELADLMMKQMGRSDPVILHPAPAGSVRRRCPDLRKLRELTDFSEEWTLEAGLRETAAFYLS